MCEVEANLAGPPDSLRQIIIFKVVMKDDIVAKLRDLRVVEGT